MRKGRGSKLFDRRRHIHHDNRRRGKRRMSQNLADGARIIMQGRMARRRRGLRRGSLFSCFLAAVRMIVMMMAAAVRMRMLHHSIRATPGFPTVRVRVAMPMVVPKRSHRDDQQIADHRQRGNRLVKKPAHGPRGPKRKKHHSFIISLSALNAMVVH